MSASLSVLVPIPVVGAVLASSNVVESDHAPWAAGTTYAKDVRCISATTHRIYQSAVAGNLGHDPTDIANRTGTIVYWIDVGPTNRHAMFDGEVSTQTSVATSLTVALRPGALNSIFAAGIDAETYSVSLTDAPGGTEVFAASGQLESSAPADYYEYFFDRFMPQTDLLVTGIPPYIGGEVVVTFAKVVGTVKCGVLAVGDLRPLGSTQFGAKAKPKTYSYIKTDDLGNNSIKRRKSARDMSASAKIPIQEANSVLDTVTELLDVPAVWVGTDLPDYSGLRCYGLGSGELTYENAVEALLTINVQGII